MIGQVLFGRYRIDSLISSHAGVCVWQGADLHALTSVAIKMGPVDADPGDALLEGEAMAAVRHPGVLRLVDFGLHGGRQPCLIMENVTGETLGQRLATIGRMRWFEAFDVVAHALDGLAALHDEGLVHGDITPDQLVLREGKEPRVKVVGLGHVSLATGEDEPLCTEQPMLRSPAAYKAPEQLTGTALRSGTDIYALGVVLWQAISGICPFAEQPEDIAARISFRPDFDQLPVGVPDLPVAGKLAIDQMLRPSLQVRESDARHCARRLRTALGIDQMPVPGWARAAS